MTCIVVISGTLPDFRWLKWNAIPKNYPDSLDFESGSYNLVNPVQYETVPVDGKYGVKVNIQNVTAKDLGMYTCYVSNHLGFNYRNAFLSEREKVSKGTKGNINLKTLSMSVLSLLSLELHRHLSEAYSIIVFRIQLLIVITVIQLTGQNHRLWLCPLINIVLPAP